MMKARVKATGEIIEVEQITNNVFGRVDGIVALYTKATLDFNLDKAKHKMKHKHKNTTK